MRALGNQVPIAMVRAMHSTDLFQLVIVALAILGLAVCLWRARWITLLLVLGLAVFLWRDHPPEQANMLYWGAAVLCVLLSALVARQLSAQAPAPQRTTAKSAKKGQREIVIDGTNVMYWQDNTADLDTLKSVVEYLKSKDILPYVFLDASSRHHLGESSLDEKGFARRLGLHPGRVMVCPAQTEADAFILKFARQEGLPILSNDRFGDRAKKAKGLKLIKGVMANGKPLLNGL